MLGPSYKKSNLSIKVCLYCMFNPLQTGVAFLYPLKTSENLKVF